ncbi:maltokinase N-terminal cap-like domain-containing protein [Streptomyces sp. KR80]|uniref:maltokinase N-terminal cap-like domain-containing protein n=1 Tax=Streptomyces sp. KR80 TaxID=3457426 RepID=UPI003FD26CFF
MSEGSTRANPTRVATPAPASGSVGPSLTLLPSLVPLLREWLPRQRWFAGKGRSITGFSLGSATELLPCGAGGAAPGLLHLLVKAHQSGPQPAEPRTEDCYQLLLGMRSVLPPHLAHALIGRPTGGPLQGRTVYEALQDPRLAVLLLERLRVPGRLGTLRFSRAPSTAIPSGLPPQPLAVDQSNSSVVYGDAYILKVFRRVGSGVNPDLELPLALARAGCDRVPHPTAWFETTAEAGPPGTTPPAEPMTLGILQPYLPGSVDGWELALNSLAKREHFTVSAWALGRATAEVHTALAAALPNAVLGRQQIEQLAAGMADRLDAAAAAVPALRPYRDPLRVAFDEFADLGRRGRTWPAQRIHGDLHLGQTLRTARRGCWALIDFEGEPARPIAERRRLQPVARDIAGMLRSFDYAARTYGLSHAASGWAQEWARRSRAAYCDGYAEAAGVDLRQDPELMRAYETDKAVYEVLYEARHRPDWLPVPMAAIHRLAGFPDRPVRDGPGAAGVPGAPAIPRAGMSRNATAPEAPRAPARQPNLREPSTAAGPSAPDSGTPSVTRPAPGAGTAPAGQSGTDVRSAPGTPRPAAGSPPAPST